MAETFSADRIRATLVNVAVLVEAYGEAYLPLFEMLERELTAAEQREAALDRALALAAEQGSGAR